MSREVIATVKCDSCGESEEMVTRDGRPTFAPPLHWERERYADDCQGDFCSTPCRIEWLCINIDKIKRIVALQMAR